MKGWLVRAILLAALVAAGIWSWGLLFPGPEKIIRKRLNAMAKAASFSSKEGLIAKAWNASMVADYFTENAQFTLEAPGIQQMISGRAELLQAVARARSQVSSLSVEFPDIKVTVAPDGASAVVNVTARGKVSGERDSYLLELKMQMIKVKRDWLINQVETVKTLSLNSYLRGLPWGRPEPL